MNVLPSSRVRAGRLLLLLLVIAVSSDASADAVINGDSRKLGRQIDMEEPNTSSWCRTAELRWNLQHQGPPSYKRV